MSEPRGLDPAHARSGAALFSQVVSILRGEVPDLAEADLDDHLREACTALQGFLRAHPDSVPALRLLAEVYHRLGDLGATRTYIRRAELLDPWSLEILIISESLCGEEARGEEGGPGRAPFLDSELSSGTISTEMLIEKAMGVFRLGHLERAYTLAKLAYRIEPAKGHHLLDVWSIGAATDPQRTRRELLRLLSEVDDQAYLYLALGSIDNVVGFYDEASAWLERGLLIPSEDPYLKAMLHNELAYVLVRRNTRLPEAITHVRRALDLFPDRRANGFIRDTLGLIYLKQGDLDRALRNLREAAAKDPAVITRFHLAVALIQARQLDEALEQLRLVARSQISLESPHLEEAAILERIQSQLGRLTDLLNLGGADDIKDALSILEGLA